MTATRDVKTGDEVTVSYVDVELGVEERRRELREVWFFECFCERCKVELKGGRWKGIEGEGEREVPAGNRSGEVQGFVVEEMD